MKTAKQTIAAYLGAMMEDDIGRMRAHAQASWLLRHHGDVPPRSAFPITGWSVIETVFENDARVVLLVEVEARGGHKGSMRAVTAVRETEDGLPSTLDGRWGVNPISAIPSWTT